jgi:hypothetical protein
MYDKVSSSPLHPCLMTLEYEIDKNKLEVANIKAQQRKK